MKALNRRSPISLLLIAILFLMAVGTASAQSDTDSDSDSEYPIFLPSVGTGAEGNTATSDADTPDAASAGDNTLFLPSLAADQEIRVNSDSENVSSAATVLVTVCVTNSQGDNISADSKITYKLGAYDYFFPGDQDVDGCRIKSFNDGSTLEVWVTYNDTTSPRQIMTLAGDYTFNFQTVALTMRLQTCSNVGLPDGTVRYRAGEGYWYAFSGKTGPDGVLKAEVMPGKEYSLQMQHVSTSQVHTYVIPDTNAELIWKTTNVTLNYGGAISYGGAGDYELFKGSGAPASKELLPGTYKFHFRQTAGTGSNLITDLTFSGCNFAKTAAILRLRDSNGEGLGGGTARGGTTTPTTWHVPGQTDEDTGLLLDLQDVNSTSLAYEMKYNNTTAIKGPQNPATNPFFDFQTVALTMRLQTCNEVGLPGGLVSYGAGSKYDSWWLLNQTQTNEFGEIKAEFLPGNEYSFQMQYAGTSQLYPGGPGGPGAPFKIPNSNETLIWTTTKVTLNYGGNIAYGGSDGGSRHFKQTTAPASKELLPGTYKFRFGQTAGSGSGFTTDLTLSGCDFTKTAAILRLRDHTGLPLEGGTARGGATNPTTWHVAGKTDKDTGLLLDLRNGMPATLAYEMKYNNTIAKKGPQNPATHPFFDFQTVELTIRLQTCNNEPLAGGKVRYGAGNTYTTWWLPGGVTGADGAARVEVLPGNKYSFEMQYKGTAQVHPYGAFEIPVTNTELTWKTTNVTLTYGGPISYGGSSGNSAWFKSNSTQSSASMALLPGNVNFNFRPNTVVNLPIAGCDFNYTYPP